MNRERAKELLPIIQAFGEGEDVQSMHFNVEDWKDDSDPKFEYDHLEFRIKPKPVEAWAIVNKADNIISKTSLSEAVIVEAHMYMASKTDYKVVKLVECEDD